MNNEPSTLVMTKADMIAALDGLPDDTPILVEDEGGSDGRWFAGHVDIQRIELGGNGWRWSPDRDSAVICSLPFLTIGRGSVRTT